MRHNFHFLIFFTFQRKIFPIPIFSDHFRLQFFKPVSWYTNFSPILIFPSNFFSFRIFSSNRIFFHIYTFQYQTMFYRFPIFSAHFRTRFFKLIFRPENFKYITKRVSVKKCYARKWVEKVELKKILDRKIGETNGRKINRKNENNNWLKSSESKNWREKLYS